jgi:hypothetical protein
VKFGERLPLMVICTAARRYAKTFAASTRMNVVAAARALPRPLPRAGSRLEREWLLELVTTLAPVGPAAKAALIMAAIGQVAFSTPPIAIGSPSPVSSAGASMAALLVARAIPSASRP